MSALVTESAEERALGKACRLIEFLTVSGDPAERSLGYRLSGMLNGELERMTRAQAQKRPPSAVPVNAGTTVSRRPAGNPKKLSKPTS